MIKLILNFSNHVVNFFKYLQYILWNARPFIYTTTKRMMDIVASIILMLVFFPFLLLVALLIKTDSRGPLFYSQERVGKRGVKFKMYKFRSMVVNADNLVNTVKSDRNDDLLFKSKNDPRVTSVGKWIRKLSIDELPQLWNVLIGDLSLVGPRPALLREVANYRKYEYLRLNVEQGITCLWQIGGRSHLSFKEQVALDLKYQSNRSILTDIMILIKTIPAVLSCRGAF